MKAKEKTQSERQACLVFCHPSPSSQPAEESTKSSGKTKSKLEELKFQQSDVVWHEVNPLLPLSLSLALTGLFQSATPDANDPSNHPRG